jgi:signal transduction histidine kinase
MKRMRRLSLVLLFLTGFFQFALSQDSEADSLLVELKKQSEPARQVDMMNEISSSYYHSDVEKGLEFAIKAGVLAEKERYFRGQRVALTLQGYYFFKTGDFSRALELFRRSSLIEKVADEPMAHTYVLTGNLFRSEAQYDSAELYYQRAIKILTGREKAERHLAFVYRNLGRLHLLQWKNESAKEHLTRALELSNVAGSRFGQAEGLLALGELYRNLGEYQKAQNYIDAGCAKAEGLSDEYLKLSCIIYSGEIQYKLGEFLASLETLLQAVELLQRRDDPQTTVRVYSGLGDVYEVLSQNDLALRYYMEALKIAEKVGLKLEMGKLYSNVAWIYKNQRNFSPSFEFADKSLKIREEIRDEFGIANSYNVRGIIYFQQKKYPEAIEWINKALELRRKIGHLEGVSGCLYNLGLIFEEQKDFPQALSHQISALAYEKKTGNKFNIGIAYSSIGSLFTYQKKFDSAYVYLKQADDIGKQTGSLELQMDNAFYWSEFYEYQGKHREALAWHKKYASLNDSVYHETSATKLAEMQALYQTEKKDKEITLLHQEKMLQSNQLHLQEARINLQNYVILFVIIAFALVSLLSYKTFQYNKVMKRAHLAIVRQKEELVSQSDELQEAYRIIAESHRQLEAKVQERTSALREAYKELDTFFYRASHDFRRPLTTFQGLAEVAKITLEDPNAKELFEKVRETAVNLDKMLFKLQSISDLGSQQLSYAETDLVSLFHQVLDHFKEELELKKIRTCTEVSVAGGFYSYTALVYMVIENLVENSIAFCRYENAQIKLRAYHEDGKVIIQVEDNGDGIDEKFHARIFEMYFRGNDRSKGNGLGLYIIRKAVEKLQGSIAFDSCRDKGTLFTLSLPVMLEPAPMEEAGEVVERMHL